MSHTAYLSGIYGSVFSYFIIKVFCLAEHFKIGQIGCYIQIVDIVENLF